MSVRTITYLNTAALAGLSWEKSPRGLKETTLGLRWGNTFAPVADADLIGSPSLLSLLLSGVTNSFKDQTLLVGYCDDETSTFFGALTSGAKPVLEPEHLFETQDALLSWLAKELNQDGVQGVVLSADLVGQVETTLPVEPISEPPADFEPVVMTGRARKFDPSKYIENMSRGAKIACVIGLAVLSVGGVSLLLANRDAPSTELTPLMRTVFTSRNEAGFLQSCTVAFGTPWNVGPGWALVSEGCAAPGMEVPIGVSVTGPVAYQILSLRTGYDAAIARAAAEVVLGASEAQLQQSDGKLIITRPIELLTDTTPSQPERAAHNILPVLESAYLGKARTVRSVGLSVEVTMWGGFAQATEPLASLPWAQVQSLSRRDGLVTLIVGKKLFTPIEIIGEG